MPISLEKLQAFCNGLALNLLFVIVQQDSVLRGLRPENQTPRNA